MEKHHKFSIWYVLLGIWAVLLLHNLIFSAFAVRVIPYSKFLDYVKQGKVAEVRKGNTYGFPLQLSLPIFPGEWLARSTLRWDARYILGG